MFKKSVLSLIPAAMLLILALACGGSDDPDSTPTTGPGTQASPTGGTGAGSPFPSPTATATLGPQTAVAATATARTMLAPTIAGEPEIITNLNLDLQWRGVALDRIDISNSTDLSGDLGGCLEAPYRSYVLPAGGRLHMFLYDSAAAASTASVTVPPAANCRQIIWSRDINYFLHDRLIIFTVSDDRAVYQALTEITGSAFACGVGINGPTTCGR